MSRRPAVHLPLNCLPRPRLYCRTTFSLVRPGAKEPRLIVSGAELAACEFSFFSNAKIFLPERAKSAKCFRRKEGARKKKNVDRALPTIESLKRFLNRVNSYESIINVNYTRDVFSSRCRHDESTLVDRSASSDTRLGKRTPKGNQRVYPAENAGKHRDRREVFK